MAGYAAKFNCPGCGSPLQMQEGTISLRCAYCNLIMRVGTPGQILKYIYPSEIDAFGMKFLIERHYKSRGLPLDFAITNNRLYYLPFYRFKGMTYSILTEKITEDEEVNPNYEVLLSKTVVHQRCRNFDLTIPAFSRPEFGLDSLGIRPEVIPLSIFSREIILLDSELVDLTIGPADARKTALAMFAFNMGFACEGKECLISEIVGEGLSVIYYPVWGSAIKRPGQTRTIFVDGLARRVINEIDGVFESHPIGKDESGYVPFKPVGHKCPNCGFDLPVSESSLTYYCANCDRLWLIKGSGYVSIEALRAAFEQADGHFPFWRFPFKTGDDIATVGQFSKILTAEIPLIAKPKASQPFYLYAPAFKIADLDALTNDGLRLCRTQPILDLLAGQINPLAETVLPDSEALELARFYWSTIRSRYKFLQRAKFDFKIEKTGPGELIWLTMPVKQNPAGVSRDSKQARLRAKN